MSLCINDLAIHLRKCCTKQLNTLLAFQRESSFQVIFLSTKTVQLESYT